jgi:hypothetical protein
MNTAHSSWVLRISRPAKRVEKTLEAAASAPEFSAVSFTGSAVAADLQLAGQLCVRILIGSLLLFPLIARLNVAGSAIGQLPISLARRPRDRQLAIVAGGVFFWTEAIPGDAAAWRASRAANTGGATTR